MPPSPTAGRATGRVRITRCALRHTFPARAAGMRWKQRARNGKAPQGPTVMRPTLKSTVRRALPLSVGSLTSMAATAGSTLAIDLPRASQ